MRCPKCGHSEEPETTFWIGGQQWTPEELLTLYGDEFEFSGGSDGTRTVYVRQPTLWQRLKTWWRA